MNLWLDDMRPAPEGWLWVKTVDEAITVLQFHEIKKCSLDHDLGACEACLKGMCAAEWLEKTKYQSMPHCEHFGTGYELVCWMEEKNIWPVEKPTVHSANPVGRAKMLMAINKHYEGFV